MTGYQQVRDVIIEGPQPWSHLIFMEAKEHIFLFLPILAVLQTMTLRAQDEITGDSRYALLVITGLLVLLAFVMAGMGYLISSGFRAATGPATLLGTGGAFNMGASSQFQYYVGTIGSIWFVTAVTLATELSPALKDLIASVFAHHWLGKSILTLAVFGLIVVVTPQRQFDDQRWANYVLMSVIVGGLLILGYFFFHYLTT